MPDSKSPLFLHISDAHFSTDGTKANGQDIKNKLVGTKVRTNEELFESTLAALVKTWQGRKIAAILLTGDYDNRGPSGGMKRIRDILKKQLGNKDLPPIVVVPGNHDVLRDSAPNSSARYAEFIECWRDSSLKHVTPFLDEIDEIANLNGNWQQHCFVDSEKKFIVVPINSCNWAQSKLEHPPKFDKKFWDELPELAGNGDSIKSKEIKNTIQSQLGLFLAADAALISDEQFSALKIIVGLAEDAADKDAIKIALIHHHLLPVDSKEEHKIYGDIINLGAFRQFLRQHDFKILLHGHKHTNSIYVDHIYKEGDENIEVDAHEILVISGGAIGGGDACRSLELQNLPYAPICNISSIPLLKAIDKNEALEINPNNPLGRRSGFSPTCRVKTRPTTP
ncbi:MAG: metallophosphoesterase [Chlamydiota bacterium]|nr:metallophosphoesterase [Chlamydiota bacterium]